jgi:hypothetical protein
VAESGGTETQRNECRRDRAATQEDGDPGYAQCDIGNEKKEGVPKIGRRDVIVP